MKKVFASIVLLMLSASVAYAKPVKDWRGLEKAHKHTVEALDEMKRAQKANNYDLGGHAAKAEEDLLNAEKEISASIEYVKHEKGK